MMRLRKRDLCNMEGENGAIGEEAMVRLKRKK